MSRFEIEDIVSQDKRGIVFHAHDKQRGHTVALRRFFPFGQEGGGLNGEESVAFVIAAERLSGITHPALRSVISGAVDPIDGMPFVVAEWIDGAPLDVVLAGGNLDPRLVIQLLRLALEVSLELSEILAEEAVWVETEIDSVFVGSEESGRGFVFWLSPFKWLGAEFGSRKLSALAELGEQLAGWKGKRPGDDAGQGLAKWMRWLRDNPDTGLAVALETLDACTSGEPAPPTPKPPAATDSRVKVKQPSPFPAFMIAACIGLLLTAGGLAYYVRFVKARAITVQKAEPESSPTVAAAAEAPRRAREAVADSRQPPEEQEIKVSDVNALAEKLAREAEADRAAAKAPPAAKASPPPRNFTPGEGGKMRPLKQNTPASVTGVLRGTRFSTTGKSLYFDFSDQDGIRAVAHLSGYKGDAKPEAYAKLIGKKLRFDGTVFREPSGRQYVKITSRDQIKEVK